MRGGGVAWAGAGALLALAGCAGSGVDGLARHVAPLDGPTARLVMRGAVQPGDVYFVVVYEQAEGCARPRVAGTGTAERHPTTTALAAQQPATVGFVLFTPERRLCSVIWTFTPQAGRAYLLSGRSAATSCAAPLFDMTDADAMVPAAGALRRNAGSPRCVPLAESRTLTAGAAEAAAADTVLHPGRGADELQGLIAP